MNKRVWGCFNSADQCVYWSIFNKNRPVNNTEDQVESGTPDCRKRTCCNEMCGQTVAPCPRQRGGGSVCSLTVGSVMLE